MPHRGDPERIYRSQRASTFRRLVANELLNELDAEHWIVRWEHETDVIGRMRGSLGFWADGWDWMAKERAALDPDRAADPPQTTMDATGDDGQVYGG